MINMARFSSSTSTLAYFCCFVFLVTFHSNLGSGVLALDTDTAVVANDGSSVLATDPAGNTATNQNDHNGRVSSDFKIGGKPGKVGAETSGDGSNLAATGPNGEQQTATIDNQQLNAKLEDKAGGNTVIAKGQPGGSKADVSINGNKNYVVSRPNEDSVDVVDQQTGGVYKVKGIQSQKVINVVSADGKKFDAAMDKNANGDVNTKLKQNTFMNFGPASASQLTAPTALNDGSAKLFYSPLDASSGSSVGSVPPVATITVDKINTKPCPEKEYGDAFGDNGIKIVDGSISVELPPTTDDGTQKTYAFPGCFIMKAAVQIPPTIDPRNVGGQVQATMSIAGDLQCDRSLECQSNAQNRPTGSCFFCDFCEKDSDHQKSSSVFGTAAESVWNICSGRPGNQLPLSWKVCPKDGTAYNALQPMLNLKGDIEATVKIFIKTTGAVASQTATKPAICNTAIAFFYPQCKTGGGSASSESWQMVGCRKTVISYKLSAFNQNIGSSGSAGLFGRKRR